MVTSGTAQGGSASPGETSSVSELTPRSAQITGCISPSHGSTPEVRHVDFIGLDESVMDYGVSLRFYFQKSSSTKGLHAVVASCACREFRVAGYSCVRQDVLYCSAIFLLRALNRVPHGTTHSSRTAV